MLNNEVIINKVNGQKTLPLIGMIKKCSLTNANEVFDLECKVINALTGEDTHYFLPLTLEYYQNILKETLVKYMVYI